MLRVLSMLLVLASSVPAAAGREPCREPAARTTINGDLFTLKDYDVPVSTLIQWLYGFTCKRIVVEPALWGQLGSVAIWGPAKLTAKQAHALFVDALAATGLAVDSKRDTITITLAPGRTARGPARSEPSPAEDLARFLGTHVKRVDATHYEVTTALRKEVAGNGFFFVNGVRITPLTSGGEATGYELDRLHPSSLFVALGFKNGDVLHSINGKLLVDAYLAEVFREVAERRLHELVIDIVRGGKPLRVTVTIVAGGS